MARVLMVSQCKWVPSLSELPAEDALGETPRFLATHDLAQTLACFVGSATVGRGLHRVGVGAPDVGTRHLVAIAFSQPAEGEKSNFERECRLLVSEVSSGPDKRLRVARAAAREGNGLVVETGLLGGGKSLRSVAGPRVYKIGE